MRLQERLQHMLNERNREAKAGMGIPSPLPPLSPPLPFSSPSPLPLSQFTYAFAFVLAPFVHFLFSHLVEFDSYLDMLQTIQREGKKRAGWKMQGGKNVVSYFSFVIFFNIYVVF